MVQASEYNSIDNRTELAGKVGNNTKYVMWLVGILITLSPLLFEVLVLFLKGELFTYRVLTIFRTGNWLLIAATIPALAIVDIIALDIPDKKLKIKVCGSCIITILLSGFSYVYVSQNNIIEVNAVTNSKIPKYNLSNVSIITITVVFFIIALIASSACVKLNSLVKN